MDHIETIVLTLTDIIRDIAEPQDEKRVRSILARYLGEVGVGELLGATGKTRPTFPTPSVPVFAALLAAHEDGSVTPKRAVPWLEKQFPAEEAVAVGGNVISRLPEFAGIADNRGSENAMLQAMQEFIVAVKEVSPVPEDRAISRSQAAEMLLCAPKSVGRFVCPIRRGVYSRRDVLLYLKNQRLGSPQARSNGR